MTSDKESAALKSGPMAQTIHQTVDRMKALKHLPQELVSLLGPMSTLHLASETDLNFDLSGMDLSYSPLCRPSQFPLDLDHLKSMTGKILDLILDHPGQVPQAMPGAAEKFKDAIQAGTLDLKGALKEILDHRENLKANQTLENKTPILSAWSDQTPGAPAALTFLILGAAAPGLKAWGAAIAQAAGLDTDQINSTGACPVCGSPPYILELRDKEGKRYAHCSLCRYSYRISRLACPSCNTQDPEKIKYFTAEEEKGFRVETCDACKTYVKTIDFRSMDQKPVAQLNDLESIALDLVAQDAGYLRLAPSVWGI